VRKLSMALAAAALMLGALVLQASAQTQLRGAACIRAFNNATPMVRLVGCRGRTGYCGCGPGWIINQSISSCTIY
jgi:hypothetical protein